MRTNITAATERTSEAATWAIRATRNRPRPLGVVGPRAPPLKTALSARLDARIAGPTPNRIPAPTDTAVLNASIPLSIRNPSAAPGSIGSSPTTSRWTPTEARRPASPPTAPRVTPSTRTNRTRLPRSAPTARRTPNSLARAAARACRRLATFRHVMSSTRSASADNARRGSTNRTRMPQVPALARSSPAPRGKSRVGQPAVASSPLSRSCRKRLDTSLRACSNGTPSFQPGESLNLAGLRSQGNRDLGHPEPVDPEERPWRDANDGKGPTTQGAASSQHRRVAPEVACPELVADHGDGDGGGFVVRRYQETPSGGGDAECPVVVAGDEPPANPAGRNRHPAGSAPGPGRRRRRRDPAPSATTARIPGTAGCSCARPTTLRGPPGRAPRGA